MAIRTTAFAGLQLPADKKNELLKDTILDSQSVQYPWQTDRKSAQTKKSELDGYVDYYHRVMAAYKQQQAARKQVKAPNGNNRQSK